MSFTPHSRAQEQFFIFLFNAKKQKHVTLKTHKQFRLMATQSDSVLVAENNSHFQPWHSHSTFKQRKT